MILKRIIAGLMLISALCTDVFAVEPPKKEIRAAWLATVYGLDWPRFTATNDHSRKAQQLALCDMLDKLYDANFNTIFFQTRLRGDVAYYSNVEQMSATFSGQQGRTPGYDPLAFVVEECHKRGMECHAWFVTYPLGKESAVRKKGKKSVVSRHRSLCERHLGEWYLNPGAPGTTEYLLQLVHEIVANYDIDGIHFDYVRYPEKAKTFPDKGEYRKYGGRMKLEDWRRRNINSFVYRAYDCVKRLKPWVQVSSSPLGKYSRIPKVPNAGWTSLESVHQDPKDWLMKGKHDMIVPMMYYRFKDFFPFMDNWVENSNGRLIVPGLGAYRMTPEEGDWALNDITDQMDYSRFYGGAGCTFYRCENLLRNEKGIFDELKNTYYKYPAQLPPLTWLNDSVPEAPSAVNVSYKNGELKLSWDEEELDFDNNNQTYTVYYSLGDTLDTKKAAHILATGIRGRELYLPVPENIEQGYLFRVSKSSRYHIESAPSAETYYYHSRYLK